jgi:hypothetical protein
MTTADPHDRDREDQAEPEPEPAHTRPGLDDMRASLAVARAVLLADDQTAHAAAAAGTCPACTVMAGVSFGITLGSIMAGDPAFVSEPVRGAMLAAVDAAEIELRSAPN